MPGLVQHFDRFVDRPNFVNSASGSLPRSSSKLDWQAISSEEDDVDRTRLQVVTILLIYTSTFELNLKLATLQLCGWGEN